MNVLALSLFIRHASSPPQQRTYCQNHTFIWQLHVHIYTEELFRKIAYSFTAKTSSKAYKPVIFTQNPTVTPCHAGIHRIPVVKLKKVKEKLDKMVASGKLKRVDHPTNWCSNMLVRGKDPPRWHNQNTSMSGSKSDSEQDHYHSTLPNSNYSRNTTSTCRQEVQELLHLRCSRWLHTDKTHRESQLVCCHAHTLGQVLLATSSLWNQQCSRRIPATNAWSSGWLARRLLHSLRHTSGGSRRHQRWGWQKPRCTHPRPNEPGWSEGPHVQPEKSSSSPISPSWATLSLKKV